ncbi:MAG: PAS domain S-box protein, partial [Campylobacterales bacterium]|nr:PAS domain S-box protein [Campylobacterales bacterium]
MPLGSLHHEKLETTKENMLDEALLFELSVVPQMVVDGERRIVRVNKRFSKLFGYEPLEILGQKTLILTPTEEKFYEYETYFRQTKEGMVVDEELLYKHKDGTLFWTKLEGIVLSSNGGEYFVLWSFINIDKEVKYREQL